MGRRGWASLAAVRAVEQSAYRVDIATMVPHFNQGPDNSSDHMPKKPVCLEAYDDRMTILRARVGFEW